MAFQSWRECRTLSLPENNNKGEGGGWLRWVLLLQIGLQARQPHLGSFKLIANTAMGR